MKLLALVCAPALSFGLRGSWTKPCNFGPDAEAENIPGDYSEHSRHVGGWTTADAAAVERREAILVSSALAEASSSSGSSSSTNQSVFDSGERGRDGAQDLLLKHLQEAEVNEECAGESACAADEDLRRAWAESFEMWALSCGPWTRKLPLLLLEKGPSEGAS